MKADEVFEGTWRLRRRRRRQRSGSKRGKGIADRTESRQQGMQPMALCGELSEAEDKIVGVRHCLSWDREERLHGWLSQASESRRAVLRGLDIIRKAAAIEAF